MARKQLMISMSDLPYHLGIKMRIYPSSQQKRIIAINCGVSRAVYNKLITINSELLHLRKTGIYIQTVAERIETLELRKKKLSKYYSYMSVRDVDSLAVAQAKLNNNAAWKMFKKIHSSGVPKYHKKGVSDSYQTSCIYTTENKKKETVRLSPDQLGSWTQSTYNCLS